MSNENSGGGEMAETLAEAFRLLSQKSGPEDGQVQLADALAKRFEYFKVIEASAQGYRAYMTEQGWDPHLAEQMAADQFMHMLHDAL